MFRTNHRKRLYGSIAIAAVLVALAGVAVAVTQKSRPMQAGTLSEKIVSVAASVLGNPSTPNLDDVEVNVQGTSVEVLVKTSHFAWAPDHVGKVNVPGEGHAHLVVDQNPPVTLVGGPFKLSHISKGWHVIKVELAENNHTPYPNQTKTVKFEVTD